MADQSYTTTSYITLKKPDSGSFQNIWDIPVNENWDTIAALFAGAVEVGHTHSGEDGQGPQLDHVDLLSVGSYTHAQIDAHIDSSPLHKNTQVQTISGDHLNSPSVTIVSNVSEIQFSNATVVDKGSGVVRVIALGTSTSPELYSKVQSAPVAWTDNFNWPHATSIGTYCWESVRTTDQHPEFLATGPAVGAPGTLARIELDGAVEPQGYALQHATCHVPHGTVQRVTLHVDRLEGPAGEAIDTTDDVTLTLDLLSATIGKSFDRPAAFGLSLVINKPAGSDTLDFALSLRPHGTDDNQEVIWTDFSGPLPSEYAGTFDQLPQAFLAGCHEFSLRRDPDEADAFWLQYYYNEGLVFRKYFSTLSADPTTALFASGLQDLVSNLGNWPTDPQPVYGRMGWGLGYNLVSGAQLICDVSCATVCSQDDVEVVTGPVTPYPEEVSPPGQAAASPCCPGYADFDGLAVGDAWDFDGPGLGLPEAQWTITGIIGDEYGTQNGPGFEVQNLSDGTYWPVFCAPPTLDTFTSNPISGYQVDQTVELTGISLPAGNDEHATLTITHGDSTWPLSWLTPGSSQFYNQGDTIAAGIITVSDLTWTAQPDGSSKLTVTYNTGPNLPWGRVLDFQVEPGYDVLLASDYTASWTAAVEVVAPPGIVTLPGFAGVVAYWDDVTDPANPEWVLADVLTPIPEGSWVYITVSAANWPMGATFWDEGNGFVGWTIQDTATGGVLPNGEYGINFLPSNGLSLLWSQFTPDTVPSDVGGTLPAFISGDEPPSSTAFTTLPPGYQLGTSALPSLGAVQMYAIIKLDDDYYTTQGGNTPVTLALRNPLTGSVMGTGDLPETLIPQVNPRAPVIDDASLSISTTTFTPGEEDITLSFKVSYLDAVDNTIELGLSSGWDATMPATVTIDGASPAPTMSLTDNGDGTVTVEVDNLKLGTSGAVRTYIKNSGISDTLPNQDSVAWGVVDTTTAPVIAQDSIAVYENAATDITIRVKDILTSANVRLADITNFTVPIKETADEVLAKTPDGEGYYAWDLRVIGIETSGVWPTTVNLIVDNGNGNTDTLTLISVESAQPCITEITVDDPTPQVSGGEPFWNFEAGIANQRTLYFHTTGINNTLPDKPSFVPTTDVGPGTLAPVGNVTLVSGAPPAAAIWAQDFLRSSDVDATTQISFLSNTASNGDPKTCTLSFPDSIEFIEVLGLTYSGSGGEGDQSAGTDSSKLARAQVVFSSAPEEGHYSEFTVYGRFSPADGAGSDITVDFYDENGSSVTSSVTVTSASSTAVSGYVKFADDTAQRILRVRVTNSTLSKTTTGVLNRTVVTHPAPRVRGATMTPPHEGTTGATITVVGSNLTPPDPPTGASALSYGYTFFDSAASAVLSSVTLVSASSRQLVFTANVAASTAGETIGIAIDYLGGNTHRAGNLITVLEEEENDASITDVRLYAKGSDLTSTTPTAPQTFIDGTAWLMVVGTGLGAANVASDGTGLFIEVVGELDDGSSSNIAETPPGPGTTEALASTSIYPGTFRVQSDTQLLIEVPCTPAYSNARIRVHLVKPATHPDGAVEWDQAVIDDTGEGTARNLPNVGLTTRYGAAARTPKINTDPTAGVTHYDVARAFQANSGAGTEGDTFSVTVRLESAVTTADAPAVVAVADSTYGVEFEDVTVAKTANPLEIQITVTVPTPGVNNTYPLAAFDSATPAVPALRFANGQPIAAVTLGASDWGSISTQVPF